MRFAIPMDIMAFSWLPGTDREIRANEPGNLFYILHRSQANPQVYKVMEQYESAEALDAHGKADYFREANKVLGTLVAAAPEIELLDTV
jgi:quinol monooxygenase YgiN